MAFEQSFSQSRLKNTVQAEAVCPLLQLMLRARLDSRGRYHWLSKSLLI
jgi:hypothetical protein